LGEQTSADSVMECDCPCCPLPSGLYRRLRHLTGSADLPAIQSATASFARL